MPETSKQPLQTNQTIQPIQPIQEDQPAEPDIEPNIAGFLQRSLAFFTDAAVLIAAGTAIGFIAMDQLAALGPWGKAIGTAVTVLYFSYGDSSLFRGASPGKRFMGLMVVGADGMPVSPVRATLRSLVLIIPLMVDARCPTCSATVEVALGAMVYGGTTALAVLFILNKATRQSIHDLLAATYVIKAGRPPHDLPMPPVHGIPKRGHYFAALVVGLIIATFITIATVEEVKSGRRAYMAQIVEALGAVPGVGSVHALAGDVVVSGKPVGFVQINVRLKQRPSEGLEAKGTELVRVAIEAVPGAFDPQKVRNVGVRVSYGYDIGVSVRYETFDTHRSPTGWRKTWSQRNE